MRHSSSRRSSTIIFAVCAALLACAPASRAAAPEDSKIFTPYFNMNLSEGWYLPSKGDIFSGGNMDTQVGLLTKLNERNNIFGLYSFRYQGPSFQPQDSTQFQSRQINHLFSLEYRWLSFSELWRIRPGASYAKTFSRTGGNEDWGTGLYNMKSVGGQLAVDYLFTMKGRDGSLTAQYLYRSVKFPNYTDLLQEFQGATSTSEISEGLYDQGVNQYSLRANWNRMTFGLTYSRMGYDNQTIVENTGVYGSAKQKDKCFTVDIGAYRRWGLMELYPVLSASMYRSNQGYLRYKYFGATPTLGNLNDPSGDVTYVGDNYSYNQYDLNVPVEFNFSAISKWSMSGGAWLTRRNYTARPPRDANNNYMGGTQNNTLVRFYAGFRKHMNDVADFRITYMFTVASSNNKFEYYMPYNYIGNSVNFSYNLAF